MMKLFMDIKKKLPGFTLSIQFESEMDKVGLLGASGSGKSMTLRCLAGIDTPDSGRVILNGKTLFDSQRGINLPCRQRNIGFLFQNYALFPNMTVEENISFGLEQKNRAEKKTIIQNMIRMIRLEGLEKRYPHQLSGGQQQRVALARALAVEPEAILLDEPFSALDEHLRSHMIQQLLETMAGYQGVMIFVTHNMEEAYRICNELTILAEGQIEAKGGIEGLFNHPPSLVTAQLMGCKNFSRAKYISPCELEASDWGIKLKTGVAINEKIKYVGIHDHLIKMASNENSENTVCCKPTKISETPFKNTIYFSAISDLPDQKSQLQWVVTKEKWLELKEKPKPWSLQFRPESLFVI